MIRIISLTITFVLLNHCIAYADELSPVRISGFIRNTSALTVYSDTTSFSNLLLTSIQLQKKTDSWKFFSDARVSSLSGEKTEDSENPDFELPRAFIRIFSSFSDVTIGKTYINFGNPGIFNPFDLDREIDFTDTERTREGLTAAEMIIPFGYLSGIKIYGGIIPESDNRDEQYTSGGSIYTNIGYWDMGMVHIFKDKGPEITGAYFKGDLFIAIQASWALRSDYQLKDYSNEIKSGIDYSFFSGSLIFSSLFHYYQDGNSFSENNSQLFFNDRYYQYFSITYIHDEFLTISNEAYFNIKDRSSLIIPSAQFSVATGLRMMLLALFNTGQGGDEFSAGRNGICSVYFRLTAYI